MKNILIVGGGFAGIKTALSLEKSPKYKVTLLSDQSDFRYYPSLYRTATGGRKILSSIPLDEIFSGKDVVVIQDAALKLDRSSKRLATKGGLSLAYDYLVLALGVKTNFFGIKGLKEYSFGIRTTADAERLKAHLHQQMIDLNEPDLNYVVVGGGPTGIELAGELPSYLKSVAKKHKIKRRAIKVELIEASPSLAPRLPKDFGKKIARRLRRLGVKLYLNTAVEAETTDSLTLTRDNREIKSHTVIWTAGISNNPFFDDNNFQLTKNGKVRVDQYLQSEPDIYVLGDNADTPYSGMGQTALHDGAYAASILKAKIDDEIPQPYGAKKPIYVLPAGPHWAAVLWGNIRFYGLTGWWLRRLADLLAYHDFEPWRIATKRWMAESESEESCPVCSDI